MRMGNNPGIPISTKDQDYNISDWIPLALCTTHGQTRGRCIMYSMMAPDWSVVEDVRSWDGGTERFLSPCDFNKHKPNQLPPLASGRRMRLPGGDIDAQIRHRYFQCEKGTFLDFFCNQSGLWRYGVLLPSWFTPILVLNWWHKRNHGSEVDSDRNHYSPRLNLHSSWISLVH